MRIYFNDEDCEVVSDINLTDLMEEKQLLKSGGLAVAINNAVIPKTKWNQTHLKEGDKLTVITATAGG